MATILERKHPSGNITWKVTFRRVGLPSFNLTFDDFDEASKWIEENEALYYVMPEKYFKWREEIYFKMSRERKRSYKNILKPKTAFNS